MYDPWVLAVVAEFFVNFLFNIFDVVAGFVGFGGYRQKYVYYENA